ncbi:MAG: DUF2335 domain-containing protein [bacterium]|nr:DUF2335 domain-containing protein [bacterium]
MLPEDDKPVGTTDSQDEKAIEPVEEKVETVLEALKELPENKREVAERAFIEFMEITHEMYSGPLPPPRLFSEYEKVLPGSANRILQMAENQQLHRQKLETTVIESDKFRELIGLGAGFIMALTALVGGIHLLNTGRDVTGFLVLTGEVVTLAGVYFSARNQRRKELEEGKSQLKPNPDSDLENE